MRHRKLFTAAAAVLASTTVVLAFTSGSYALWNKTEHVAPSNVDTGSMALTVNGAETTALASAAWGSLTPGDSSAQAFLLANAGDSAQTVDAAVIVSSTDPIKNFMTLKLTAVASEAACLPGLPGSSAPLTGFSASGLAELAIGASTWVCVEVALGAAPVADSGQSAQFTLTMAGRQTS